MDFGYSSMSADYSVTVFHCTKCGHTLGEIERVGEKIYDDMEGWLFCPYCSEPLYPGES